MSNKSIEKSAEAVIYLKKSGLLIWAVVILGLGMFLGYGVRLYQDMQIINSYVGADAARAAAAPEVVEAQPEEPLELNAYDFSGFASEGPADAEIVAFEISDLECPFCQMFNFEAKQAIKEAYGDQIRWVFVDLPLDGLHPFARDLHHGAYCAGEQDGHFEFQQLVFAESPAESADDVYRFAEAMALDLDAFGECMDSGRYADQVEAGVVMATEMGFTGTPAIVIAKYEDGEYGYNQSVMGAQPAENFFAVIDAVIGE